MSKPAIKIDELSAAERSRLIEELCDTASDPPLTEAQRHELDRRLGDLERD